MIWYYVGIYADLDIQLHHSFREFIKENLTKIVWEPEEAMLFWTEFEKGSQMKTLMLSAFLLSGQRFSNFIAFYVNWVVANHLSGRHKWTDHVIGATGPRAEAEAYYYYVDRITEHDSSLQVWTYPQFQMYAEHFSEATWQQNNIKNIKCLQIDSIYSKEVLILGKP